MFLQQDYSVIPDTILQQLIEVIPDHVLSAPPIFTLKTGELLQIHPLAVDRVTKIIRQAWCYSRIHGRAYIEAEGTRFRVGQIGLADPVTCITTQNSYYQAQPSSTFQSITGTNQILGSYSTAWYNRGILNDEVKCAYQQYCEVVDSLNVRIRNSLQTMLSLFVDPDEKGLVGGTPPDQVMDKLDEQYRESRRMYAPEGSKLSGVTASLDGIDHVLDAFWIRLGRAAKIPSWMMTLTESNSSFMLEEREADLTRMWIQFCLEPYYMLFMHLGMDTEVIISPPDYRTMTHRTTRNDLISQTDQRRAMIIKLEAQVKEIEQKIKTEKTNARVARSANAQSKSVEQKRPDPAARNGELSE